MTAAARAERFASFGYLEITAPGAHPEPPREPGKVRSFADMSPEEREALRRRYARAGATPPGSR